MNGVVAGIACESIVSGAARDRVIAVASADLSIAMAGGNHVVSDPAENDRRLHQRRVHDDAVISLQAVNHQSVEVGRIERSNGALVLDDAHLSAAAERLD